MKKDKETDKEAEEVEEEAEAVEEESNAVRLGKVATAHEVAYMTPDGNMTTEEYLVWMGNLLLKIKEGTVGVSA